MNNFITMNEIDINMFSIIKQNTKFSKIDQNNAKQQIRTKLDLIGSTQIAQIKTMKYTISL